MLLSLLILTLIVWPVQPYCTNSLSCFKSKLFNFDSPPENYYNNTAIFNNQSSIGSITTVAYGDFNDDFYTDLILINSGVQYTIYTWDIGQGRCLNISASFVDQVSESLLYSNSSGIFLVDLNIDGNLDFLIYSYINSTSAALTPYIRSFVNSSSNEYVFTHPLNATLIDPVQPFIIDVSVATQQRQQFVVQIGGVRTILNYNPTSNSFGTYSWATFFNDPTNTYANTAMAAPHMNSFLDFTGDCQADVVIMSNNGTSLVFQFWIRSTNSTLFQLASTYSTPKATFNSLSFSDINYDGSIDMILIIGNNMSIFYHSYSLRSAGDFCSQNLDYFPYQLSNNDYTSYTDLTGYGPITMQNIHFGDVNSDGYPEFLFMGQQNGQQVSMLLNNDGGEGNKPVPFRKFTNPNKNFINSPALYLSFFDFLENGIYDFLIITPGSTSLAIYNNNHNPSNFFIKGYCLFGKNSSAGSIYSGASFYWVNTVDSTQLYSHTAQLFQTAYNSMQLPYVLNGLGRANNYVEQFYLGISNKQNNALTQMWSPIIPNSQLAVYASSSPTWTITIFVLPTQNIIYVVLVTIVILFILGCMLLGFYIKEKKKKEKMIV